MAEMTLEQQRAIALANARLRLQEQGDVAAPAGQEAQAVGPSLGDRAARVAGLGARGLVRGATAIPTMMAEAVAAPLRALTGGKYFPSPAATLERTMTQAGLPQPATTAERLSTGAVGAMSGVGSQLGALSALRPTSGAGEAIRQTLLQQPGRQVTAAATGATGAGLAAEMGAGPLGQFAAGMAGGMLPFAPQMLRGRPTPEMQRTNEATVRAQQAGYRLPPSQARPGAVSSTLEGGIAGKAATERAASLKNQPVTNRLAKQDLGLQQNRPITVENLREYRQVQAEPYREIARIGPNVARALDDLGQFRADATAQFKFYARTADPSVLAKARSLKQSADAIESQFEQLAVMSGKPDLINRLRQARTNIAKSHGYEAALDDVTGNIDARILASQFDKGAPLSGGAATIAKTANVYGPSMRLPENVGPNPGLSMFDYLTALTATGGAVGTQNPAFMLGAALPLARPAVRSMLLSRPYQATLGRPSLNPLSSPDAMSLGILSGAYGNR